MKAEVTANGSILSYDCFLHSQTRLCSYILKRILVLWFRKQSSSVASDHLPGQEVSPSSSSLALILGRCSWPTSVWGGRASLPTFLQVLSLRCAPFSSIQCLFNELCSGLGPRDTEENEIERPCPHRAYILGEGMGAPTMKTQTNKIMPGEVRALTVRKEDEGETTLCQMAFGLH